MEPLPDTSKTSVGRIGRVDSARRVFGADARAVLDRAAGHYQDPQPTEPATAATPPTSAETEQDTGCVANQGGSVTTDDAGNAAPANVESPAGVEVAIDLDREEHLRKYCPQIAVTVRQDVKDAVVALMLAVPYVTRRSDNSLLSHIYHYAAYMHAKEGRFDPNEHLTDRWIAQYFHDRRDEISLKSAATVRSALHRIRAGAGHTAKKRTFGRSKSLRPYSPTEWTNLRSRVTALNDQTLKEDLTLLLDLTGEAGLRSSEAVQAEGFWISEFLGVTLITVPDADGVVREVPVFGDAATRLLALKDTKGYLLTPGISQRTNVITRIRVRADRHPGLQGFRAIRARNTWLSALLTSAIPYSTVCFIAGIHPGNNTPTDLLGHIKAPAITTAIADVSAARPN
ncbi:hypothetical protein [Knoellia aerolata]|uniref:Tyr recombinase domain-containing protein n=1 Tax=Knoellia aerolata DSM 18566 TaxID=1385519 RepID=A0A0A0JKI4_9MICO|nr:hypothetical protein [Knoellia aerolata]KGN36547.1 hypothetical protein N801_01700 [Knoellia aerolata DSM 18566]